MRIQYLHFPGKESASRHAERTSKLDALSKARFKSIGINGAFNCDRKVFRGVERDDVGAVVEDAHVLVLLRVLRPTKSQTAKPLPDLAGRRTTEITRLKSSFWKERSAVPQVRPSDE